MDHRKSKERKDMEVGGILGQKRGNQSPGCQTPSVTLSLSLNLEQLLFKTQW